MFVRYDETLECGSKAISGGKSSELIVTEFGSHIFLWAMRFGRVDLI